jgi:hypothetical protein
MTHATKAIYKLLLSDFVKISKVSVDDMLYDEQDIARTMEKIEVSMTMCSADGNRRFVLVSFQFFCIYCFFLKFYEDNGFGLWKTHQPHCLVISNAAKPSLEGLGPVHTMAGGREAVDFHQSNCKKSRVRPLDPSHYGQSPKAVAF